MRTRTPRHRALLLQVASLLVLVYPFVSSTFRDNDQATILSGGWQIARRQTPFLHALFYNFDKQWGAFLALTWLYRLVPRADPVWAANFLLTIAASLAWLSVAFRLGRTRSYPFPLVLPVLLSPVLILYMPYFGTAWLSLAFLLLGFFFIGDFRSRPKLLFGLFLVVIAAACRGDVVLAIPALALSQISRARFRNLVRRPLPWLLAAAAIVPVLAGKLLAGAALPDTNPFSFDARSYFGFLFFGFTPALLSLLLLAVAIFLRLAIRKPRFRFFYTCFALSPLIPLGFYSLQLYTLRYLFLTIAAVLFVVSSRRSVWLYRSFRRARPSVARRASAALVALTIFPWLIGFNIPVLSQPRLTVANPTRFPTGDGAFPMDAYLGFAWQTLFEDHLRIDHNQKIWLAARSVRYRACNDGTVPLLITPMSDFLEFAIRLQNKRPRPIDYLAESPCGWAYVDVRSIIRGYRPTPRDGPFFLRRIVFASTTNNGELIALVDSTSQPSPETRLLTSLAKMFAARATEIFTASSFRIPITAGVEYAVFSDRPCRFDPTPPRSNGLPLIQAAWVGALSNTRQTVEATCPAAALSGWARTVEPPYIGL